MFKRTSEKYEKKKNDEMDSHFRYSVLKDNKNSKQPLAPPAS
jgi:hypothetical protein